MKTFLTIASILAAASSIMGCKTTGSEPETTTKDVVTQGGLVIKHYYSEGETAHRGLCPFGLNTTDVAEYREKCNTTHSKDLTAFAEKLESLYRAKYKNGAAMNDEETELGGLLVQSLSNPDVLKVKLNQTTGDNSEIIVSRMAGLFDPIFTDQGGNDDDDGDNDDGDNDDGDAPAGATIMQTQLLVPFGVSQSPLLISQNPLKTNALKATVSCPGVQVIGMQIAEGGGQPILGLQALGGGKFKTNSGNKRKMAMVQVQMSSSVQAFCTVTVTNDGASDGGGDDDNDPIGGEVMMTQSFNVFGAGQVQPFQIIDLSPLKAKKVEAKITGCNASVQGLQVSEGPGQIYLQLQGEGAGVFKTQSGNQRNFYAIMVNVFANGPGACTLTLKKIQ